MKTINQETILRIKKEIDIIDLASEYYDLVPFGDLYKARCKHGDSTPSLIFYPVTQSFHCYGCHAGESGSDVISFIQWMEDLPWAEAVEFLADKANILIEEEEDPYKEIYKRKLDLNRKYWRALQDDPNTMEWYHRKGLSDEDIERWRLGSSSGKPVYSIMDSQGRTVGFSYRNDGDPKYINDKNDEIFKKGNVLYGLNVATTNIRKKKYVVVVEGYNDAILLNKFDVPAVALMGTALTEYQLEKLSHLTKNVILWLDGDEAGITNTESISIKLANKNINTFIINVLSADPDEVALLKREELEDFIIKNKKEAFSYIVDRYINIFHEKIFLEAKTLSEKILPVISSIQKEEYRDLLYTIFKNAINLKELSCTTQP